MKKIIICILIVLLIACIFVGCIPAKLTKYAQYNNMLILQFEAPCDMLYININCRVNRILINGVCYDNNNNSVYILKHTTMHFVIQTTNEIPNVIVLKMSMLSTNKDITYEYNYGR